FDENGEPLYACGAKKGDRRYRYFVSRKLIRGTEKTDDRGWRLPAVETERTVMAALRQILSDRGALASALASCGLAAAELKHTLAIVERKVNLLETSGFTSGDGEAILERVELRRDG